MASVGADNDDAMFSYESIIHGHYIYKDIWTPSIAEVFSCCDLINRHNRFAVAIFKTDVIVGHMPKAVNRI